MIASFPPPYGGVANHVRRLSALLDQRGISHVIYNAVSGSGDSKRVISVAHNRTSWLLKYALTGEERGVYIFSDRLAVWLLGAYMATRRNKRVIVRLRNQALPQMLSNPLTRSLAAFALQNVTCVVAVSWSLAEAAASVGVPRERIVHQPGFLPPALGATEADALSRLQLSFVEQHTPILAANGKVGFHLGSDLYGLDHLVELVAQLVPDHPRLGLAISFWDHKPEDEGYLGQLRDRAARLGIADNILFHIESRPFVPLLTKADLFLRPTCTDGDANSIREALYLGVPVIASDVVERPAGTILARTRDLGDLVTKAREVLLKKAPKLPNAGAVDMEGVERYVALLRSLVA